MAYTKEQWVKARGLFEIGKSPQEIADEVGFKSRDTVSKKAIKENWEKSKILQTKDELVGLEKENSTIQAKNSTMVGKISTLEDYQIEILKNVVEDETGNKSLLFSTANLSLIRKNQMLQKNTKKVMSKVEHYEDGKKIMTTMEEKEVELNPSDLKTIDEGVEINAKTLEIAPRHANSQLTVNTQNNQIQNNVKTLDDFYTIEGTDET